ncbi:Mo-dependent nitrogenase C-terminal domain-containing protein [Scytonema millei]|uniref:Nitrogenase n=1 Tax=Scytonema millei VB511283 TaxID=1245923 RepID=A0A9X5E4Z4_9CYAN|nr:Mo-dependent nitrogenase C-terminal domain-containing protein [Scytonema millei]NHC35257.1 nitrogenase [Scytonema millei VB511283]
MNTRANTNKIWQSLIQPTQQRLESIEIRRPKTARFVCRVIPASCPFERDIRFFDRSLLHVPPLCKLNPFYEQLVLLRMKSLTYLAQACSQGMKNCC